MLKLNPLQVVTFNLFLNTLALRFGHFLGDTRKAFNRVGTLPIPAYNPMRNLFIAFILLCFVATAAQAQTFTGETFNVSNSGTAVNAGVITAPNSNDVNFTVNDDLTISVDGSTPTILLNGGPVRVNSILGPGPDPNNAANFLVQPSGTRNNMGHLEFGDYGFINGSSKWLGLGSAPASLPGPGVYGQRIQWNSHLGIFNLREVNTSTKDLIVQWGGTTSNNRLRFEYVTNPFGAAQTFAVFDSNGDFGIGNQNPGARLHVGTGSGTNSRIRMGSLEFIQDGGGFTMLMGGTLIPDRSFFDIGTTARPWDRVVARNFIAISDQKLKTNVQPIPYGLNEVLALNPVTYNFKDKEADQSAQFGFLAQEVQQVTPEIVVDPVAEGIEGEGGEKLAADPNAALGVNYTELIPILIRAIQEQQQQIAELQQRVGISSGDIQPINRNGSEQVDPDNNGQSLLQNYPNPFTETTTIQYAVPEESSTAELVIYNLDGTQIRSIPLARGTNGSIDIKSSSLAAGVYLYSLVIDGEKTETKKMVVETR